MIYDTVILAELFYRNYEGVHKYINNSIQINIKQENMLKLYNTKNILKKCFTIVIS